MNDHAMNDDNLPIHIDIPKTNEDFSYLDIMPEDDAPEIITHFQLRQVVIGLYMEKHDAVQIYDAIRDMDGEYANVSLSEIKKIITKYREETSRFIDANPNLLEKRLNLIMGHIQELNNVLKQQWKLYNDINNDKARVAALAEIKKTIMDIAKLQNLVGSDQDTKKHLEEMREANHRLAMIVKEVTHNCPSCKKRLQELLGKARVNPL